jgi:hypothetical protein
MRDDSLQIVDADPRHPSRGWWKIAFFAAVILVILLVDLLWIWRGVNPYSLWLDDQWVAALVRHASLAQLLEFKPPVPIGFVFLLKAMTAVIGAGHTQLQALPLIFGLLQVALIGCVAWRATRSMSLGLVAAILLSGSRVLMVCSLRVKQYTLEGLIALSLIALALECVRRPRAFTFVLTVIAALVALPFSFSAIALGLVVVNVLGLHMMGAPRSLIALPRWLIIAVCATFDLISLMWVLAVQSRQANDLMFGFWVWHYLPIDDPPAMWSFARTHLAGFFAGALPAGLGWLAAMVPLTIVLFLLRKPTRLLGVALALFWLGMFAASAVGKYPLGGGRTDAFSYPITILTIVGGIWALSRLIWFLPHVALLTVGGYALVTFPGVPVDYPKTAGRAAVEELGRLAGESDGLIIPPNSAWAFGCYGPWAVDLVEADDSSNRFLVVPRRSHSLVVREVASDSAEALDATLVQQMEEFLSQAPKRIWYISVHSWQRPDEFLTRHLEASGYRRQDIATSDGSVLLLFVDGFPLAENIGR